MAKLVTKTKFTFKSPEIDQLIDDYSKHGDLDKFRKDFNDFVKRHKGIANLKENLKNNSHFIDIKIKGDLVVDGIRPGIEPMDMTVCEDIPVSPGNSQTICLDQGLL